MHRSRSPGASRARTWLLAIAAVLTPTLAQAQGTGMLSGVVTDRASGAPINGARVQVVGEASLGANSDDNGRYFVRGIPTGQRTVRVTRIGFRPEAQTVTTVHALLDSASSIGASTGTTIGLTGQTVANIEISERLAAALPTWEGTREYAGSCTIFVCGSTNHAVPEAGAGRRPRRVLNAPMRRPTGINELADRPRPTKYEGMTLGGLGLPGFD